MSRQRRMLWASVSTSLKVNSLSLKAALLWTWAISHFDDEGFQEGHPKALKGKVVPMREDISEAEIPALTEEIVKQGLWITHRYKSPTGCEQIYIQDPVFDDKQPIHGYKTTLSKIKVLLSSGEGSPNSGEGSHQERVSTTPEVGRNRTELNRTKLNRTRKEYATSKDVATSFDIFWNIYPSRNGKKVTKKESRDYYFKHIKPDEVELILKATRNYADSEFAGKGYIKDPIRFLKKDFWKDWIEPEEGPPDPYADLMREKEEREKRRNEEKTGAGFRPIADIESGGG